MTVSGKATRSAVVPAELHGSRLDLAASQLFPDFSRARLQSWIRKGELRVDGRACRPRDPVSVDSRLELDAELPAEVSWAGEPIPLDIVHEDDHVIVVNKPAGLVVHPAAGHASGTLVNALLDHAPELEQLPRGGIVHRLDKETSGIMVAARSLKAHQSLVAQLAARSVKREYRAVCFGRVSGGGTVDAPMGRHPTARTKMAVVSGGKPAVTHYRLLRNFAHFAELAVTLETGRTHQIRVHMAWKQHPLVGDPVYAGRLRLPPGATPALVDCLRGFNRQALHARTLAFDHPDHGGRLEFATPLPEDLVALLDCLEREDVDA